MGIEMWRMSLRINLEKAPTWHGYRVIMRVIAGSQSTKVLLLLLHPFNGLFFRTTWISRYQKGKSSLDLNESGDNGFWGDGSGVSWTVCKQSAPGCRQITMPTPYHSVLQVRCSSWRPTNSVKAEDRPTETQFWELPIIEQHTYGTDQLASMTSC